MPSTTTVQSILLPSLFLSLATPTTAHPSTASPAASAQPTPPPQKKSSLGLAFGLSAAFGVAGVVAICILLWCLRRRHIRRKAEGESRETQDTTGQWCTCKNCSGCARKRDGSDGSQPCWRCKESCGRGEATVARTVFK
ncbi:hypothetical protein IQ07DRAFT_584792 [Pyrenochaeta sp. DS3sAY3a]|nr:hypothetical protein IQ07DRAFT_584792 [Pyrenochaeta sp. DS3sAY3a]